MEVGKMYNVPDDRLYPKLVELTKQVFDKFTTTDTEALVVAQLLGHSSLGGAFYLKTGLMSQYGLIERRAGKIRVTDIARRIIYPNDTKEKAEGLRTALFKITLWERLYQEYTSKGAELPANFWADLAKIADIPPDDAKNKADWVAKAYNIDVTYLKNAEKENSMQSLQEVKNTPSNGAQVKHKQEPSPPTAASPVPTFPTGQSGVITFISADDGINATIPRSARFIDVFKTSVENYLKIIKDDLVHEATLIAEENKKQPDAS